MERVSKVWGLEAQTALWESNDSKSRMQERPKFKFGMAEFKEVAEAKRDRIGDSISEKTTQSMDCRSQKAWETGG